MNLKSLFMGLLMIHFFSIQAGELTVFTTLDSSLDLTPQRYFLVDIKGTLTAMNQQALALYQCTHLSTEMEKKLGIYILSESESPKENLSSFFEIQDRIHHKFNGVASLQSDTVILTFHENEELHLKKRRLVFQAENAQDFDLFFHRYGKQEGSRQLLYTLLYVAMDALASQEKD